MERQKLENLLHTGIVDVNAGHVREALSRGGEELFNIFPEGPFYHAMVDCASFSALHDRFKTRKAYNEEQAEIFRILNQFHANPFYEHDLDDTGIKLRTVDIAWINMFDENPEATENEDGDPLAGNPEASSEIIIAALDIDPTYTPDFAKSFLQLRLTPKDPEMDRVVESSYRYMEAVRDRIGERMRNSDDFMARFATDMIEMKAVHNLRNWTAGEWDVRAVKPWILPESYKAAQDAQMDVIRQQMRYDMGETTSDALARAAQAHLKAEGRMQGDILFDKLTRTRTDKPKGPGGTGPV